MGVKSPLTSVSKLVAELHLGCSASPLAGSTPATCNLTDKGVPPLVNGPLYAITHVDRTGIVRLHGATPLKNSGTYSGVTRWS